MWLMHHGAMEEGDLLCPRACALCVSLVRDGLTLTVTLPAAARDSHSTPPAPVTATDRRLSVDRSLRVAYIARVFRYERPDATHD